MRPDTQYTNPFRPVVTIGDYVALLGTTGLRGLGAGGAAPQSGLYQVTGRRPIPSLGRRGLILIWIDPTTGNAVAGYDNDGNFNNAHINPAAEVQINPLQSLQLGSGRIAQVRFRFKAPVQPTGAIQDYDFRLYHGAVPFWNMAHAKPAWNSLHQVTDPTDQTLAAAQGANQAYPTAYESTLPMDFSHVTEMIVAEDESLTVGITNNGAGVTAAGAWGVAARGWVYDIAAVRPGPKDFELLPGITIKPPLGVLGNDIAILQTDLRQPTK